MEHAVTGEPVAARRTGIGAVAQVPAVELGGDGTGDWQIVDGEFVGNRGIVADGEDVPVVRQAGLGIGRLRGVDLGHGNLLAVESVTA